MDQSQLERLAAILGRNENGYRDSAVTEATELREIIRQARPDLYELMLAEEKRELAPVETKALVPVKTERQRYYHLKNLENCVTVPEGEKTSLYIGQATQLKLDLKEETVVGCPKLTKYIVAEREGWYVQPWPPAVRKGPVLKKKKAWKVEHKNVVLGFEYDSPAFFFGPRRVFEDYRKRLKEASLDILLEDSLLDTVFNPIDQQLKELYDQIKNSA